MLIFRFYKYSKRPVQNSSLMIKTYSVIKKKSTVWIICNFLQRSLRSRYYHGYFLNFLHILLLLILFNVSVLRGVVGYTWGLGIEAVHKHNFLLCWHSVLPITESHWGCCFHHAKKTLMHVSYKNIPIFLNFSNS